MCREPPYAHLLCLCTLLKTPASPQSGGPVHRAPSGGSQCRPHHTLQPQLMARPSQCRQRTPGSPPSRAPKARLQTPSLIFKQCPGLRKTIFSPRRSFRAIPPWPPPGRCGQRVLQRNLSRCLHGGRRENSRSQSRTSICVIARVPGEGQTPFPKCCLSPAAGGAARGPAGIAHALAKGWFCVFFMTQAIKASGLEPVYSGPWRRGRGCILVPLLRQVSRSRYASWVPVPDSSFSAGALELDGVLLLQTPPPVMLRSQVRLVTGTSSHGPSHRPAGGTGDPDARLDGCGISLRETLSSNPTAVQLQKRQGVIGPHEGRHMHRRPGHGCIFQNALATQKTLLTSASPAPGQASVPFPDWVFPSIPKSFSPARFQQRARTLGPPQCPTGDATRVSWVVNEKQKLGLGVACTLRFTTFYFLWVSGHTEKAERQPS